MKIYMGPYKNWFGPYHLVQKLFWFLSEEKQDIIADKIPMAPFRFIEKLKGKRKIKIHIDGYDVWNMDDTLAHIIVPMLKLVKEDKQGAPYTDDEDVPDELKSTSAPPKEKDYYLDDNHFKRWEWIVDEMIWAFEQKITDWEQQFYSGNIDHSWKETETGSFELVDGPKDTFKVDKEGMEKHHARMKNGFRLFGKYYEALWN
jgi:hypothetical protein